MLDGRVAPNVLRYYKPLPYLILLTPRLQLRESAPRIVRFRHVLTVGRAPTSHLLSGSGETHLRHFAIVYGGAEHVIYDHDGASGTFLGWSGAERWWRLGGGPAFLESGMFIRAGRLLFKYLDTRGQTVAPLPDLHVTPSSGWSWAQGPDQLPPAVRVPRAG